MAPAMATTRLRKELIKLKKDPTPEIIAEPDESNILKWHYAIQGPSGTAFEGGEYVGKLIFPSEYPMKAPSIYMLTPSGRFAINTKLCMSMSDFHPESWNPMWSVSSIIQGIQSFMASDELTTGGLRSPESEHKKLAAGSVEYNRKTFPTRFGGNIQTAFAQAEKARIEAEKKSSQSYNIHRRSTRSTKNSKKEQEFEKTEEQKTSEEPKQELTPEEIEKRRKKNARKRAKQKAKKVTQVTHIRNG